MEIRYITILTLALCLGCSTTMHFVRPGATQREFRRACEHSKQVVKDRHAASHRPRPVDPYTPGNGLAQKYAVNAMANATFTVIRALSGYTWKDIENFQKSMESLGWTFQEGDSEAEDVFTVKLSGAWNDMVLEYP